MKKAIPKMQPTADMLSNDFDGKASRPMKLLVSMPSPTIRKGRKANAGAGHDEHEAQPIDARSKPTRAESHSYYEAQIRNANGAQDGGHISNVDQKLDAPVYPIIAALWRQRYAWVKSRTSMTLAAQARCRAFANGDKGEAAKLWKAYGKGIAIDPHLAATLIPYSQAIAFFDENIKPVEKQLGKLIKGLPCYEWLNGHKGIGPMYIAGIYGECAGPITKSHSVSALWKFFGLAVFEGKRQAFSTDAKENKRQSYSPRRRSLVSQIESGLIMAGNQEWKAVYEERKAYELARGVPKGHAHNRAKRYMGKRFLRQLYAYAKTVEIGHFPDLSHPDYANLQSDLNGHFINENHFADAVQGEAIAVMASHNVNASPQIPAA